MPGPEEDFLEYATAAHGLYCPYCGEKIEIIVDQSVPQQTYVEDCFVCCRPITLTVTVGSEGIDVSAHHENE